MKAEDLVITGIPRSGTTLTCHLLNKLPNVVALHEPMRPKEMVGLDGDSIVDKTREFFVTQRRSILESGVAVSKSVNGAVPDNSVGDRDNAGSRKQLVNGRTIAIAKPLTKEFTLGIKHPVFFTAMLESVNKYFRCVAVIRNPLSVLLSWNSVTFPVSQGRTPVGEAFDPKLAALLREERDRTSRQLILLAWFYERYLRVLSPQQVIRYEDIVASNGKALAVVMRAASDLNESLSSRNENRLYDPSIKQGIAARLLGSSGAYWEFYSRHDVTQLLGSEQGVQC
jgi:hypothetical protein